MYETYFSSNLFQKQETKTCFKASSKRGCRQYTVLADEQKAMNISEMFLSYYSARKLEECCLYFSLEKANSRLLEELRQKELEYNALQDEVRVLNDRLINFRNEHVLELGIVAVLYTEKNWENDL